MTETTTATSSPTASCRICGFKIAKNQPPIDGYRHSWENGYPEVPFHEASPTLRPRLP